MTERRTAWHYYLGLLLEEKAPRCFEVRAEEPVTRALQHMDWLILRRRPWDGPVDAGETLVELWPMLPAVTIAEFKSASKQYRARDLHRLLGYGHQFFSANALEVEMLADLALVLMVAERNKALDRDLADVGLRERAQVRGYSLLDGAPFKTVLVDFAALTQRQHDDFVAVFVPNALPPSGAWKWWYAHHGARKEKAMNPQDLEDFDAVQKHFFSLAPIELRLAGLTPEQIAHALTPEQLAQALTPEQHVLALPDEALRALSAEYIASLSDEAQSRIRTRLGR